MAAIISDINTLYEILRKKGVLKSLEEIKSFPDEPHLYFYSTELNSLPQYHIIDIHGNASGFSFFSRELALLKSLSEASERLSNSSYYPEQLIYTSYNELIKKTHVLSPKAFMGKEYPNTIFGWKEGYDFFTKEKIFLPAQALFFSYQLQNEPKLTEQISTGAAGGFNVTSTVLRAILETIERDAFMCMYLTQIPPLSIHPASFTDTKIQLAISQLQKYNIEFAIYDISSDLDIPCFMTILIDKSGLGPAISVGLKAGFDIPEAIVGSIQEAIHIRIWIKTMLIKKKFIYSITSPQKITTLLQRGLYWVPISHVSKLDFILNQQPVKKLYTHSLRSGEKKLEDVKKELQLKNKATYIANITHSIFGNSKYVVYKAVIPDLQPLFLNEKTRLINKKRLKEYATNKGQKSYVLNTIPQPFI